MRTLAEVSPQLQHLAWPSASRAFSCLLMVELLTVRLSQVIRNLNINPGKDRFMHESLQITFSYILWTYLGQHSIK